MESNNIIRIEFERFSNASELSTEDQSLLEAAERVLPQSYAPYSRFHVGAALKLSNGEIVTGTNQENAAYPSGLCAERVAIFAAMHAHPKETVTQIAIRAQSSDFNVDHPIAPCGACRQVLLEYELRQKQPIRVLLQGTTGDIIVIPDTKSLLPIYFHESGLKKE
jgi:cytidine deaminase